ncbi:hypothetical protein WAF17_19715 [Bernardetia sp. ABR2-2B]|uniref:hypothetical protein n=1 Tax=Bernardetia sp. ABR2-2B TaxID=3127472 RepID=UPI0030CD8344
MNINFCSKIHLIFFICLLTFTLSCQFSQEKKKGKKTEKNIIDKKSDDCFSPNDGVYKFQHLEGDTLVQKIYQFYETYNIAITEQEKTKIKEWLNNEVFSNKKPLGALEWYIDDDELCRNIKVVSYDATGVVIDTTYSRVCNSILETGISNQNAWLLEIDETLLILSYCNNINKKLNRAYNHAVIEDNKGLYNAYQVTTKYSSEIVVYLKLENPNVNITDIIATDSGFVFTKIYGALEQEMGYQGSTEIID